MAIIFLGLVRKTRTHVAKGLYIIFIYLLKFVQEFLSVVEFIDIVVIEVVLAGSNLQLGQPERLRGLRGRRRPLHLGFYLRTILLKSQVKILVDGVGLEVLSFRLA